MNGKKGLSDRYRDIQSRRNYSGSGGWRDAEYYTTGGSQCEVLFSEEPFHQCNLQTAPHLLLRLTRVIRVLG